MRMKQITGTFFVFKNSALSFALAADDATIFKIAHVTTKYVAIQLDWIAIVWHGAKEKVTSCLAPPFSC